MTPRVRLKTVAERMPHPLGRAAARIPFSVRLGPTYSATQRLLERNAGLNKQEREQWILESLRSIVRRAYETVPFYKHHYDHAGYDPDRLTTLEHFADVPIVAKSDLRLFGLERRSAKERGRILVNTGGSSGEPLDFFLDRNAFAREWAHMHWVWIRAGYDRRHLKITLRGHNLGNRVARFNAVHNEFILSAYAPMDALARAASEIMDKARVEWIHGYPSLVSEFAGYLETHRADIAQRLAASLRGVLLGSEFPAPIYRSTIERVLSTNVIAWYGHSEMAALAYERNRNEYIPLLTYGFCEAAATPDGTSHLLATSYWNTAGPFIRYDTEDGIRRLASDGVLGAFAIDHGRIGEFVIDKQGNRVSLTALVHGRHHPAFGSLAHLQVRQVSGGRIEVLVVPSDANADLHEIARGFDFTNTDLDVSFRFVDAPTRTPAGKIRLLIR